jgi:membrane protease YdiL (CAAX protease family)
LAGPPFLAIIGKRLLGGSPGFSIQIVLQLVLCSFAAIILFIVIRCEELPLSSIGLRPLTWFTIGSGFVLTLVALYVLPFLTGRLVHVIGLGGFEPGLSRLVSLPVWFRIFVAITSGTVEEILYRGYAVERLASLMGNYLLAGLTVVIAFGLAHIPFWGIGPALGADLPFGLVMTMFYLWRRDLVANCIAHSLALVVSLLSLV